MTKNVKYYPCCVAPYPDLTFRLRLRRRALYYNLYLIVPTGSVAALSLLTFLLPPDSGEKVGLGKIRTPLTPRCSGLLVTCLQRVETKTPLLRSSVVDLLQSPTS